MFYLVHYYYCVMKNKYVKKNIIHCPWKTNKEVARTQITSQANIFVWSDQLFVMKWSLKTTHARHTKELKRN